MPIPRREVQTNPLSGQALPKGYEASLGLTLRSAAYTGLIDSPFYAWDRQRRATEAADERVTGLEHLWQGPKRTGGRQANRRTHIGPLADLPGDVDANEYLSKDEALGVLNTWGLDQERINKIVGASEFFHRDALGVIAGAQYNQQRRDTIMAYGGSGLIRTPAVFAAQMVGSMGDPVNVVASLIPVTRLSTAVKVANQTKRAVGTTSKFMHFRESLRQAGLIMDRAVANRSGGLGRAAERFKHGAVDGLFGAGITEPFTAEAYRAEGSEYTAQDVAMGLALGTFLGGGFGAGMGALSDGLRRAVGIDIDLEVKQADAREKLAKLTEAQSQFERKLKELSPRDREAVALTAGDDIANGRRVDIGDIWMSARKAAGLTEDDPHIFLAANGGVVVRGKRFNNANDFLDYVMELDAEGMEQLGFYSGGLPDQIKFAESRDAQLKILTNYVRKQQRLEATPFEDIINWINRTGGLDDKGIRGAKADGVVEAGTRTLSQLKQQAKEAGYGDLSPAKLRTLAHRARKGVKSYKVDDAVTLDQETRDLQQLYQMLQDIDSPPKIKDEQSFRAWMDTKSDNPKNSMFYDPDAEAKYMESIKEDLTYSPEDAAKAKKLLDDLTATMASVDPEAAKIIRDQSTVISQEAANTAQYTTDLVQCLIGTLADA